MFLFNAAPAAAQEKTFRVLPFDYDAREGTTVELQVTSSEAAPFLGLDFNLRPVYRNTRSNAPAANHGDFVIPANGGKLSSGETSGKIANIRIPKDRVFEGDEGFSIEVTVLNPGWTATSANGAAEGGRISEHRDKTARANVLIQNVSATSIAADPACGATELSPGKELTVTATIPTLQSGGKPHVVYRYKVDGGGYGNWIDLGQGRISEIEIPLGTIGGFGATSRLTMQVGFRTTAGGEIEEMSDECTWTLASPVTVPGAPTGLSLQAGDEKLTASWTQPSSNGGAAISRYEWQHKEMSATDWPSTDTDVTTGTTAEITNLTNGTSYDVRVRAVNSRGHGDWSAVATGTPLPPGTIWMGTLNVRGVSRGCNNEGTTGACALRLSDDEFTLQGAPYYFFAVRVDNGTLIIWMTSSGTGFSPRDVRTALDDYKFCVGTQEFAILSATHQQNYELRWSGTGLSWSEGDMVELSIKDSCGSPPDDDTDDDTNDDDTTDDDTTDDDTTRTPTNTGGPGGGGAAPPRDTPSPSPRCGESDREYLKSFYRTTEGDAWDRNENWNSEEPLDQWFGVKTDEDGEVISLRLANNNLSEDMPTEELLCLNEDMELKELALWDNEDLSGDVPEKLVLAVERAALRAIAEMLDLNPQWFEDYEDPFDFEDWHEGVTTDDDGRVTELHLPGEIPESIRSQFKELRETMITTSEGGCAVGASSARAGASGLLVAVFMLLALSRGFRARSY